MTQKRKHQLELPILTNIKSKQALGVGNNKPSEFAKQAATSTETGFHKPASAGDQSIYKSMSESYFGITSK